MNKTNAPLVHSFLEKAVSPVYWQGIIAFYKLDEEKLSERQKKYFHKKHWRTEPNLKKICHQLPIMPENDLKWLTFSDEKFQKMAQIMGGLFYAKALATKVDKDEIKVFHDLYGEQSYRWVLKTGKTLTHPAYAFKGQGQDLKDQGAFFLKSFYQNHFSEAVMVFASKRFEAVFPTEGKKFHALSTEGTARLFSLTLEHIGQ